MQPEMKRIFKWFWAWQDEKEEAWLESMSRGRGLHLSSVGPFGIYTFQVGSPRRYDRKLWTGMRKKVAYPSGV